MLRTVVLPHPEWPIRQVNSPRRIASDRSSNMLVLPPPAAGNRLVIPSMEMKWSTDIAAKPTGSFGERDQPRQTSKHLVKSHADHPDDEDCSDHIGDRQVVPLVPHEVSDS